MESTQINVNELVSTSINSLFNNLFSSVDENMYSVLDSITFINSETINNLFFQKIYGTSNSIGILLIANSLLFGIVIFYAIRLFCANFVSSEIEQPFQFLFKCILLGIIMNFSYYIWIQLLEFNYLFSSSFRELGKSFFHIDISFAELIKKINAVSLISENTFNIFSFNGLIKSFTSFGLISLLFSYSLRYVMIKVLILITPFAILSLINTSTSWFFKSWIKSIFALLIMESLISIILLIVFSINFFSNDSISKLLFIGSIYSLIKSNQIVKELIGGITTDFSFNLSNLKKL